MQHVMETRAVAKPELKSVIKSQGRSQSWIASRIGISRFLMNHLVAGRRTVSIGQARSIADILGFPLFLLFDVPADTENVTVDQEAVPV